MAAILTARRGSLARVVGPTNVISNGDFSGGDANWSGSWYSGKTITDGKARFTASPAYDGFEQTIAPVGGKYYQLTWTVSERTSGNLVPYIYGSGTGTNGTVRAANGTFTERILVNTGDNKFGFHLDNGGTLAVDDISFVGPYNTATIGGA